MPIVPCKCKQPQRKLSKCPYFSSFYKHVFLNELNIFRISKAKAHRAADANLLNHVLKFSSAETTKGSSFNRSVERCRESDISSASALSLSFCFQTEVDFRGCRKKQNAFSSGLARNCCSLGSFHTHLKLLYFYLLNTTAVLSGLREKQW